MKGPELWIWDYTDRGENGGYGMTIVYPEKHPTHPHLNKAETIHFNKHWDYTYEPKPDAFDRKYFGSYFKFFCEL